MIETNGFQTLAEKRYRKTKKFITKVARQPIPEGWTDHSEAFMEHSGSSSHRDNKVALRGRAKGSTAWYR